MIEPQSDRVDRASLSIEIRSPVFPLNIGYWEGPAYFDIPPVRILIHETLHVWQFVSMGFLTNLALEVWRSLLQFETTGQTDTYNSLQQRFELPDPSLGFSALDIMETHARFWDIHILNPRTVRRFETNPRTYHMTTPDVGQKVPSDAPVQGYTGTEFDSAMSVASYGEPYRRAIRNWGTTGAVIFFPMVAYFSLQTPDPIRVFKRIDEIISNGQKMENPVNIHEMWRKFFNEMRSIANDVSLAETGSYLTTGYDVLTRSTLVGTETNQNRIYFLFRAALGGLRTGKSESSYEQLFCFPGDPEYRGMLIGHALPPRVYFLNGEWSPRPLIADYVDAILKRSGVSGQTYESLANEAESINLRVRAMRYRAELDRLAKGG